MILHASEAGQGPPVALLHGLFGRLRNLGAVARHLSARFRVISIDLRNHGASPHAPGMDYSTQAADLLATLQALHALPARLIGHSMGGKVAMMAALTQPASVHSLIVADIAPVPYAHHNAAVARAMLALELRPGLARNAASAMLEAAAPDPGVRGFLLQNLEFARTPRWAIGLTEIAAGMADIEAWPDLLVAMAYPGPALFLAGGASNYVREADRPVIRALFPKARFAAIAGAGHWLHADKPAEFLAAIDDFL